MAKRGSEQSKFRRPLSTRAALCDARNEPRYTNFWWATNFDKPRRKKKKPKLTLDERIKRELEAERRR